MNLLKIHTDVVRYKVEVKELLTALLDGAVERR